MFVVFGAVRLPGHRVLGVGGPGMFQDLHLEIVRTEKERAVRDSKARGEREAR